MKIEVAFRFGDKVRIMPLENTPGRVVGTYISQKGPQYHVRWFANGMPQTDYFFVDEIQPRQST